MSRPKTLHIIRYVEHLFRMGSPRRVVLHPKDLRQPIIVDGLLVEVDEDLAQPGFARLIFDEEDCILMDSRDNLFEIGDYYYDY